VACNNNLTANGIFLLRSNNLRKVIDPVGCVGYRPARVCI